MLWQQSNNRVKLTKRRTSEPHELQEVQLLPAFSERSESGHSESNVQSPNSQDAESGQLWQRVSSAGNWSNPDEELHGWEVVTTSTWECSNTRNLWMLLIGVVAMVAFVAALIAWEAVGRKQHGLSNKVVACYTGENQCDDTVLRAAREGCNVVIWSSVDVVRDPVSGDPKIQGGPDFECVSNIVNALERESLKTTHLINFGGFGARQIDTSMAPAAILSEFKEWNRKVVSRPQMHFDGFDGIDWAIEAGPFNSTSQQTSTVSVGLLDLVGRTSQLAKREGWVVTMNAWMSSLDPTTPQFNRQFGDAPGQAHNSHAYLLAAYDTTTTKDKHRVQTFDFVSVSLFEPHSLALQAIMEKEISPRDYLAKLVNDLTNGWVVQFSADPFIGIGDKTVRLHQSQVVLGVANGWAGKDSILYVQPSRLKVAYDRMERKKLHPRGFMFWGIGQEGLIPPGHHKPVYMAKELNSIMGVRWW